MLIAEMYSDGQQTPAQQSHILMHHWIAGVDRLSGMYHKSTYTKVELEQIAKKLPLKKTEIHDFYIPVDNPNKNCETLLKNCRDTLKKLETMPDSEDLIDEGNKLLKRLTEVGCASASRLIIAGYKK